MVGGERHRRDEKSKVENERVEIGRNPFVIYSIQHEWDEKAFEFFVHLIFSIMSMCLCFMSDIKLHGMNLYVSRILVGCHFHMSSITYLAKSERKRGQKRSSVRQK